PVARIDEPKRSERTWRRIGGARIGMHGERGEGRYWAKHATAKALEELRVLVLQGAERSCDRTAQRPAAAPVGNPALALDAVSATGDVTCDHVDAPAQVRYRPRRRTKCRDMRLDAVDGAKYIVHCFAVESHRAHVLGCSIFGQCR